MNLKKDFHNLSQLEFNNKIASLKNEKSTINFFSFDRGYFYYPTVNIVEKIYELDKKIDIFISFFISMNSSYNLWVMPVISYFLLLLEV